MIRSKKAETTELALSHVKDSIMAALAIILFFTIIFAPGTKLSITEVKTATHTGLLMDTLLAANGNIMVSQTMANKTISFSDKVEVGFPKRTFSFIADPYTTMTEAEFEEVDSLEFQKTGNRLVIAQDQKNYLSALSCPFYDLKNIKSINLMPLQQLGAPYTFTAGLKAKLDTSFPNVQVTDSPLIADLLIIIKEGNSLKAEIPQNSPASRRIACSILNNLYHSFDTIPLILISNDIVMSHADHAIILTIPVEMEQAKAIIQISNILTNEII